MDSYERLRQLCNDGIGKVLASVDVSLHTTYIERAKYELVVIHDLKFDDYFLFIHDIVRFAQGHGILVGPGRGSVAGSLVAYLLGITEIDPIRFGLYFERFLNKDRVSAPDIDLDFEKHKRKYVIEYLAEKWGRERVANVATYSVLQTKSVINDVGKVMGIDPPVLEAINMLFPFGCKNIHEALKEVPEFSQYVNRYRRLFEVAVQLEGCVRHTGKHAAGVIVGTEPLHNIMPIMTDGKAVMTQWDKDTLEELNYLKADILGVKTLDVIHDTLRLVGENALDAMRLDDPNLIKQFTDANSLAVFQFETPGMQKALVKVRPETFDDIFAINALERPGAKEHIDEFVQGRKTGQFGCFDERLRSILGPTYGVILYQEQTMRLVQEVAGFTLSEADIVRRGIAKKKGIDDLRDKFLNGAVVRGYDRAVAEKLFETMKEGQNYSFNKSHAVAYAYLAFKCMFLKVYHPHQFMSVALTYHPYSKANVIKIRKYENEVARLGIRVLPHDINASKYHYVADQTNNTVRRGFCSLPHVKSAAFHIQQLQPFRSFNDFYKRVNKSRVRTKAMQTLVNAGCFDSLGDSRREISKWLDIPVKKVKQEQSTAEQQRLL